MAGWRSSSPCPSSATSRSSAASPRLRTVPLHAGWNVVVWEGFDGAPIAEALGAVALAQVARDLPVGRRDPVLAQLLPCRPAGVERVRHVRSGRELLDRRCRGSGLDRRGGRVSHRPLRIPAAGSAAPPGPLASAWPSKRAPYRAEPRLGITRETGKCGSACLDEHAVAGGEGGMPLRGLGAAVGRAVAPHHLRGAVAEQVLDIELAGVVGDGPRVANVCRKRWAWTRGTPAARPSRRGSCLNPEAPPARRSFLITGPGSRRDYGRSRSRPPRCCPATKVAPTVVKA